MSMSEGLVVLGANLVSCPLHLLLAELILIQVGRRPIKIQNKEGSPHLSGESNDNGDDGRSISENVNNLDIYMCV